MFFSSSDSVLILSTHTDDFEIGMGATARRLICMGCNVHLAVFCQAVESLPEGFSKSTLFEEQEKASAAIGLARENVTIFDIPVRRFPEHRQLVLESMIELRSLISPTVIFGPSTSDIHQDHQVVSCEMVRAFKKSTVLGYQLPWNDLCAHRDCVIQVSKDDVESKLQAVFCYESQSHRSYMSKRYILGDLAVNGSLVDVEFAEVYQLLRLVLR